MTDEQAKREAEQAVTAERERCVRIAVNEYARWRDVDVDSYGLAVGAVGAAANIVAAIEGIPCLSTMPLHPNESQMGSEFENEPLPENA